MGTWNTRPFASDAALDFLSAAEHRPSAAVSAALKAALAKSDYLDVDDGAAAWAACELVALSYGYQGRHLTEQASELSGRMRPSEKQRLQALSVLPLLTNQQTSELAQPADQSDFEEQIHDLRLRLQAASSGARPLLRAKVGDVLFVNDASDGWVVQVIGKLEVAVFEGRCRDHDALEWARTQPARRLPSAPNTLLQHGRIVGKLPVRKDLKEKKLYAHEAGLLLHYLVSSANGNGRITSYEDALQYEPFHLHSWEDLGAAGLGGWCPPRALRSPIEREAHLQKLRGEQWALRRQQTSSGPFGDVEAVQGLLHWIEITSLSNVIHRMSDLANHTQGYGRPNERSERSPYAFAALVAIWRGTWPVEDWPNLPLPAAPGGDDLRMAAVAARVLAQEILSPDAELCLIWDRASDGGAEFRTNVARLNSALA